MKVLSSVILILLLAGCGGLPKAGPQAAIYDFGITPAEMSTVILPVKLTSIEAAPGLEGSEMRYRLAYQNPTRVFAYTESRWVAPPDRLISKRIGQRLRSTPSAQCLLYISLEIFDQVFDSSDSSEGVVQLHATLSAGRSKPPFAQTRVEKKITSKSADARGGAEALTSATDEAISSVFDWANNEACNQPTS